MPRNNALQSAETLHEAAVADIRKKSLTALSTHARDLVARSVQATQRVFVSKDEDSAIMKETVGDLLIGCGEAVKSGDIGFEFKKDDEGNLTGGFKFNMNAELAESIIPGAMIDRSAENAAVRIVRNMTV